MIEIQYTAIGPRISFRGQDLGYLWDEKPAVWPKLSRQDLIDLAQGQDWLPARKLHQVFFWANQKEMPEDYRPLGAVLGSLSNLESAQLCFLGYPTTPEEIKANWKAASRGMLRGFYLRLKAWLANPVSDFDIRGALAESDRPHPQVRGKDLSQGRAVWLDPGSSDQDQDWLTVEPAWLRGDKLWGFAHSPRTRRIWLVGPELAALVSPANKEVLQDLFRQGHLRLDDPTVYLWLQATSGEAVPGVGPTHYVRGCQIGKRYVLRTSYGHWDAWQPGGEITKLSQLDVEETTRLFEQVGPQAVAQLVFELTRNSHSETSSAYFLGLGRHKKQAWFAGNLAGIGWRLTSPQLGGQTVLETCSLEELLREVERVGLDGLLAIHRLARL
jgi:hypothetical protein